ncbi:DUF4192 domain-containing protein [Amycolatopsis jiangsuensis]|uniref:DUF4192 domain-containing protein n=1 Tax=Amycolatopsis jiangsuensis TaxID=1181879 RepID=A0A840IT13_9PSEU|nr:DUF4192 domain-containing protein [Amycolatopsis jiangsuensis]MBB4684963.1 hypothetical protein [Amycolatopsis jiangsuensis]
MTTSTPPGTDRVTLRNPAQLIAALPYLLGFHPADSLVLLGHRRPGTSIGLILRADLPPRELFAAQADSLVPRFDDEEHMGVTAVVVGGTPDDLGPPYPDFVDELRRALAEHDLRLFHPLWTAKVEAGARWGCYRDPECGGVLPDPRSTVAAAAVTKAGFVVYRSREEISALLEPRSPDALARRAALLRRSPEPLSDPEFTAVASGAPSVPPHRALLDRAAAEVREAFFRHRNGFGPPDDGQAVRLAHALALPPIREACLAMAVPVGSPLAREAEEVWLSLVRELPPPHRAEAACLLAYTTLLRGEGAFAGMAVNNALDADPRSVLARLLHAVWNSGVEPKRLRGLAVPTGSVDLGLAGET